MCEKCNYKKSNLFETMLSFMEKKCGEQIIRLKITRWYVYACIHILYCCVAIPSEKGFLFPNRKEWMHIIFIPCAK